MHLFNMSLFLYSVASFCDALEKNSNQTAIQNALQELWDLLLFFTLFILSTYEWLDIYSINEPKSVYSHNENIAQKYRSCQTTIWIDHCAVNL